MTVFKSSRGIACSPAFASASRVLTSGGTDVSDSGMTSPSRSGGASPLLGDSATYCSPIADWLCTSARRSDGTSIPDLSERTASTPVLVSRTESTRPTSVPR